MDPVSRELGNHDHAITTLEADMAIVKASLQRIESTLAEHKGGMRMLITVGGIGGAVGAAAVKILAFLKGG